jgi:hypothetical protein
MTDTKLEFKMSAKELKIMDNAEFVKIERKDPGKNNVYVQITRNGKRVFLVVQNVVQKHQ